MFKSKDHECDIFTQWSIIWVMKNHGLLIHKIILMNLESITLNENKSYQTEKNYRSPPLWSSKTAQSNLCYSKLGQWLPVRDGGLIGRRHAETLCDGRNDLYTDWVLVYTGEHICQYSCNILDILLYVNFTLV